MSFGSGQSITAAILSSLGVIPAADSVTPPKTTSDWKSLHLAGARDKPLSLHLPKNFCTFMNLSSKSSSAMHMSSIQFTSSVPIMPSKAVATILQKVVGAPVRHP